MTDNDKLICVLVLFVVAAVRYINRRRRLDRWLAQQRVSLKRRVERE